jgi:acyl carrier protein
MPEKNEIVADLGRILSDFNGREFSGRIDADTLFMRDLGFSSIDVVILGEVLESHYETKISFGDFINELRARNALDVMIGDLADFLQKNL